MQGSEVKELGQMLREARERKGVTLSDAQQATKIRQLFLQALETENYGVLPPPFYIRGFIKNYAIYLGLDPREAVQLFDEMLDGNPLSRLTEQHSPPSADSGGRGNLFPTAGLSRGEGRLIEAGNERLNVSTLNPSKPIGLGSADSSAENRAIVRVEQTIPTSLRAPDKYILKPSMLPTARGTFYMPNFIPALLVGIIVLAACLLVYRGLSTPVKDKENVEAATATVTVGTATASTTSSLQSGLAGLRTSTSPTAKAGTSFTPPPYRTPETVAIAGGAAVKPTTTVAPSTTVVEASPTPIQVITTAPAPSATVKLEVAVGAGGSWMDIWVDGEKKVSKTAAAGEVFSFEGGKVAVRAGKPGAITVKINGIERDYTKPLAGIITHTWFADGKDTIE